MSEFTIVARLVSHPPCMLQSRPPTNSHQTSPANAGQSTHEIEQPDVLGHSTSEAATHEREGGDEEARSAAKDIAEASVQRLKRGACDQVRRREPRRSVGGVEVGADQSIGRRRNGPIEAGEKDISKDCNLNPDEASGRFPVILGFVVQQRCRFLDLRRDLDIAFFETVGNSDSR